MAKDDLQFVTKIFETFEKKMDNIEVKIDKNLTVYSNLDKRLSIQEEISNKLTHILENSQIELTALRDWKNGIAQSIKVLTAVLFLIPTLAGVVFTLYVKTLRSDLKEERLSDISYAVDILRKDVYSNFKQK